MIRSGGRYHPGGWSIDAGGGTGRAEPQVTLQPAPVFQAPAHQLLQMPEDILESFGNLFEPFDARIERPRRFRRSTRALPRLVLLHTHGYPCQKDQARHGQTTDDDGITALGPLPVGCRPVALPAPIEEAHQRAFEQNAL